MICRGVKFIIFLITTNIIDSYNFIPNTSPSYLDKLEKKHQIIKKRHRRNTKDSLRNVIIHPDQFGNFTHDIISEEAFEKSIKNYIPKIHIEIPFPISGSTNTTAFPFPISKRRGGPNKIEKKTSSDNNKFQLELNIDKYNFSCVGGYSDLKVELNQTIDFIREPKKYAEHGVRLPRGILLEGPTGNGKTLIARCIAGEAGVNFVSCSGSEFIEVYVGTGSARVRELFKFVRENAPCILFIDEFDALGKKRSQDGEISNSERDQTLNQLLVFMDGFQENENSIVVMAATNRVDILDPAAIRPGRFDKIIHVPNPDSQTRKEIIQIHAANKPMNFSLPELVRLTNGFNGAQIENILNEATLLGIRTNTLPVNSTHLENMREKIIVGHTSNFQRNISEKALRRVATHEVGHLLMALQSPCYDRPWKITIDSMNPKQSLGYVIFDSDDNNDDFMLREYIQDKIKVLLGGRAAEEVVYGSSVSSGAFSDLEKAFMLARTMVMDYGMGAKIIFPYMSEIYKRQIDENIHYIILHLYGETLQHIRGNRPLMDVFVDQLLVKKTLLFDEIKEIYDQTK